MSLPLSALKEQILVPQAQRGDHREFEPLVELYDRRLLHYVRRLLMDDDAVFSLRYFEGQSNPEIAAMLQISSKAVAAALHKVRSKLKSAVAQFHSGAKHELDPRLKIALDVTNSFATLNAWRIRSSRHGTVCEE